MKQKLLTTLLALLAAASAKAATTLEFTNSAVDFAGNTNWTALTLPQFDPAQGQLTGVTITVNSLTYGGSFNVRSSDSELEVTVDSALGVGAIRSTGLGYDGWARAGDHLVLSPSTQPFGYIINPGANQTFNISPVTIYDDPTSIDSSFFASYTGTGLVTFEVRNSNTRVTTYPNDNRVLINYDLASVTANMTVTYTYAPIPEPTTSLLGLLGTALLFRRRRVA
jgi:hypothetical protein